MSSPIESNVQVDVDKPLPINLLSRELARLYPAANGFITDVEDVGSFRDGQCLGLSKTTIKRSS